MTADVASFPGCQGRRGEENDWNGLFAHVCMGGENAMEFLKEYGFGYCI